MLREADTLMKTFNFSKNKVLALLLSFLCIANTFLLPVGCTEESKFSLPTVSGASSVYLYHYESDQVLLKRSGLAQIAPASTVKIMTGLLAIEQLGHRLDESITVTEEMLLGVEGFKIHLEPKMVVSIRDLLYGVICAGGNDAAQVLAIACSGSVDNFVRDMNEKAISLGCTSTRYTNPTGMDDPQMTTSLDDVIRLSTEAQKNDLFLSFSSCNQYSIFANQKTLTLYNRNALISSFSGMGYQNRYVKGLNAGMTDRGGHCAVAFAEHDGNSYLCIVMGATERNGTACSYQIVNTLLNYVMDVYSYQQIATKDTVICRASVQYALPDSGKNLAEIPCVLSQDLYGFLPKNLDREALIFQPFFHRDAISAPIDKGTVVGGVDVYYNDQYVTSAKLLAYETKEPNPTLLALAKMKHMISSRTSIITAVCAIVLSTFYFLLFEKKVKKQSRS